MSPSYRVRMTVCCLVALALAAGMSRAQTSSDPRFSFDLSPDPLARSPRMLGMGQLSLVTDDPHNRINLWDFARNPAGVLDADSASTLEIRPGTGTTSFIRDLPGVPYSRERQEFAGTGYRFGYEAWRHEHSTAYGAIGEFAVGRNDAPVGDAVELRQTFNQPDIMPIVTGVMPYTTSGRMRYAVRVIAGSGSHQNGLRTLVSNAVGDYIDHNGEQLNTPDETHVSTLGAGLATSYRFGRYLTAAIGGDMVQQGLKYDNTTPISDWQQRESRPYSVGQVTLIGRLGPHFEWGADGRGWKSTSEESWLYSISKGAGAIPLTGRGKLLERKEEGTTLHTRARWTCGSLELGAGLNTGYRKVTITPPASNDLTSLNYFISTANLFSDSVSADRGEERLWEAGGGTAWHLPHQRGIVGIEYHRFRDHTQSVQRGDGPESIGWDVRGGMEFALNKIVSARTGYRHWRVDGDRFTRLNEFKGEVLTLGVGIHPSAVPWVFESGYAVEWSQADYGDPGSPRGSTQQLSAQARWLF